MSKLQCGTVKLVKREFQVFGYANDHWFQNLIRQGTWNEFTLSHLGQLVSPTDICLDIGANLGIMTLALSVSAHKGHVYAFEASPDTCEALKRTVQANGLTNVSAHNVVVGRQTDKVKFFDVPDVRSSSFYVAADSPLK